MKMMEVEKLIEYLNMCFLNKYSDDDTYFIAKGFGIHDLTLKPFIYIINSRNNDEMVTMFNLSIFQNDMIYINDCNGKETNVILDQDYLEDIINIELQSYKKRRLATDEYKRRTGKSTITKAKIQSIN